MREETELDENEAGHRGDDARRDRLRPRHASATATTPILRDISFRAAPGETIAIVGQTGSGKSTLTKLVNRIYDVTSGRILIDGVDVRDWSLDVAALADLDHRAGYLPLLAHHRREHRLQLGPARRPRRRSSAPRATPRRTTSSRGFTRWLRDRDRRARRDALGRPAPAARHRARAADRPAHPDPRRLDQRDRQRHRGRDPEGDPARCSKGARRC